MWETVKAWHERLRGWRSVIFHSLYGVPAAVVTLLDMIGAIDITPILKTFISVDQVPLALALIATGGVFFRWLTTTRLGCRPDDESK